MSDQYIVVLIVFVFAVIAIKVVNDAEKAQKKHPKK